jgi:hypothetical protein
LIKRNWLSIGDRSAAGSPTKIPASLQATIKLELQKNEKGRN